MVDNNKDRSEIRYDAEELFRLNDKKHCSISPELIMFFGKFPRTKLNGKGSSNIPYKNPYNIYLNEVKKRKQAFDTPEAFTDDKIIADLKEIASKLTDNNKDEVITNFFKISLSETCYDKVAEMLHTVAIDCIFLVTSYIELFIAISKNNPELYDLFIENVKNQLYHPKVFDSSMDEIACETSVQKSQKWRLNNSKLISHLYLSNQFNTSFMVNDMLVPIINGISLDDPFNIEILKEILPILHDKFMEEKANLSDILNRIDKISKDKSYPSRLRFLLMDALDIFK